MVKHAVRVWHYTDLWSNLQGQSDTTLTYGQTRSESLTLHWLMVKPAGDSLTLHWPTVKPAGTVWHYTDLQSNLQGQSDTTLTYGQTCSESLTPHWPTVKPAGGSLTLHWPTVKPAETVWHYTELWSNLQWQSDTTLNCGLDTTLNCSLDTTLNCGQTCSDSLRQQRQSVESKCYSIHKMTSDPLNEKDQHKFTLSTQAQKFDDQLSQNVIISIKWLVIHWIKRPNTSRHNNKNVILLQ